ncbi:hypothetical protein [Sphingomonas hengshuiensis]|uniref:Uncharacterized protein n=1 Tax=Sphingomonas hengshuiensis TaxID=1609977 RepID=A0A7U4JAT2_9SPHN|nr:hypothetical protein [Sphingomonas hengshuiensis]AJP73405.1 hypothetical protein TS85_18840 [Sphingomonas hengshuiensis]
MTKLTEGAARVIAGDITDVFNAADTALLASARVAGSVLEGTAGSGMHPRTKQKLLETLNDGYGKILAGRKEMVQAQVQMVVIQRQSNLDTVDFGCWGAPATFFTTAEAKIDESAVV